MGVVRNAGVAASAGSRDERGQGLVEYALILALVSLAAIGSLGFLSGKINDVFVKAGNALNSVEIAAGSGSSSGSSSGAGVSDTIAPTLVINTPAEGATSVPTNPTYSGACGSARRPADDHYQRCPMSPETRSSGSPYGPFTTTCTAGTWSLTHPGPGASQGAEEQPHLPSDRDTVGQLRRHRHGHQPVHDIEHAFVGISRAASCFIGSQWACRSTGGSACRRRR